MMSFFKRIRKRRTEAEGDLEKDLDAEDNLLEMRSVDKYRQRIIRRTRKHWSAVIKTKRKVVAISLSLVVAAALLFSSLVYWRLYQVQDYSQTAYNITRLIPLPVARAGSTFVSYEDYLRDLRRQIHYFETHQGIDFENNTAEDLITLGELKNQSLTRAVNQTYIRELAQRYNLRVNPEDVEARLDLLRRHNRLNSLQELEVVLQNFWGFNLSDYRRSLTDELLREAVVKRADRQENKAYERLQAVAERLRQGEDFGQVAVEVSEDFATAVNRGEYGFLIDRRHQEVDPIVLEAVFQTEVGQVSPIIDTGRRLEIIKVLADEGQGLRRVAHITIFYLPLSDVLRDIQTSDPVKVYIKGVTYFPDTVD